MSSQRPASVQRPASELPVDARPFAKLLRQVPPWGTGASDPENPIKNKAVVGRFAPVRRTDRQDKPFKERPFLVRHQVSCQADLHRRYQLESCLHRDVNPFCQHGLLFKRITSPSNLLNGRLENFVTSVKVERKKTLKVLGTGKNILTIEPIQS